MPIPNEVFKLPKVRDGLAWNIREHNEYLWIELMEITYPKYSLFGLIQPKYVQVEAGLVTPSSYTSQIKLVLAVRAKAEETLQKYFNRNRLSVGNLTGFYVTAEDK